MTDTPGIPSASAPRTWMPTTAGILCIVAGAGDIIGGIAIAVLFPVLSSLAKPYGEMGFGWLGALGIPLIVLGIVAVVGGIYALRRRLWGLALAGGICTTITADVLGILSIIFVAMSKKEFAQ